ncbi:hypothetical protein Pmar_PMAR018342 [Perkinsus marinus ATCC 50983]|uniref:RRM domain-containing protein n=1 Tax=Perkinsus marinus (strain ATCC 50983 / TXsc) TaxID=423536 RepID=C5LRY6_PERM5|nr:hypothetical protein Pmar_PMAR018342 [Perkinsus marinus ATCC 50983]EER00458.1 hypothetical protein Pmar_PMAR018342 [Perkinsus marinus ATCC 50983]|eukprot:XP_002767740.1 hypothetical protein Pmar_PMAR018342 [Perkinsus marinus ATCC 50983]
MNPPISTFEDDELFLKEVVAAVAAERQDGGAVATMGRHGGSFYDDADGDTDAALVTTTDTNNNILLGDILQTLQHSEALLRSVREENSGLRTHLGILEQQLDRTRENLRDLTARKLLESTSITLSPPTTTTVKADSTIIPVNMEQDTAEDDAIRGTANSADNDVAYSHTVGASEDHSASVNTRRSSSTRTTTKPVNNFTISWSSVVKGELTDTTTTDNEHTATPTTIPVDAIPTMGEESDRKYDSVDEEYGSGDHDDDMLACIPDEQVVCVKKIQLIKANVSTVLHKYFSSYGHVVTILLLQRKTRSHTSTLPPNMGFVVMSDSDAVRRILHNPEHNIQEQAQTRDRNRDGLDI